MERTDIHDYLVRVYQTHEQGVLEWVIQDRTEREACREAEADISKIEGVADWSLTQIAK